MTKYDASDIETFGDVEMVMNDSETDAEEAIKAWNTFRAKLGAE